MTAEYLPVPVAAAKQIADVYQKSMVVILCYDPVYQLTHTTTYGREAFDKEQAAAAGEICTKAVGADLSKKTEYEDFHRNYDAARYREALELLKVIRASGGTTVPQLRQIERLLAATGFLCRWDGS